MILNENDLERIDEKKKSEQVICFVSREENLQ